MGYLAGQILRASQMGGVTSCTSATRPSTPSEGQIIVESDTGMVAIYSGANWRYLAPTGEVSTHAEYNSTVAQSIPNSADTKIAFATDSTTTALVTKTASAPGHTFTLNRAGTWAITLTTGTASATGQRTASIRDAVAAVAAGGQLGTGVANCFCSLTRYFASGSVIWPSMFQSTGGAVNTLSGTGENRLHIAWLHS